MLIFPHLPASSSGSSVKIVTWANGTDDEIKAMIQAADLDEINLADYWSVSDERAVHLSAMIAGSGFREAQPEQDVVFVLMNEGYPVNPNIHFVWGQKDCLLRTGRMNSSSLNSGSWKSSIMRSELNDKYYNALPATFRSCLKRFNVITAKTYNASTIQITQDYISLFAEQEVFGSQYLSNATEAAELSQIEYYKTASNIIKQVNGSNNDWWERSPTKDRNTGFCCVLSYGSKSWGAANSVYGVAPFGCI